MKCQRCGAALEGEFELDRLSGLSAQQRQFIVDFLKCRGNIKEMEKTYAISYPTVRARLDEIVAALGEAPIGEGGPDSGEEGGYGDGSPSGNSLFARQLRRIVLEKLAKKGIDAQTAMEMIELMERARL
jgi:hypothetical protein